MNRHTTMFDNALNAYDVAEGVDEIEDLFDFMTTYYAEERETDRGIGITQLPGYTKQPPLLPLDGRAPQISYGEITTTHPAKSREGLAHLNQDMIYPHLRGIPPAKKQGALAAGGRGALVQYDSQGNVVMRVLSPDQQRIVWQGNFGQINMPPTSMGKKHREQLIEDRVRALVARATGQTFLPHTGNDTGAALLPDQDPREARAARRAARFDAFENFLDDEAELAAMSGSGDKPDKIPSLLRTISSTIIQAQNSIKNNKQGETKELIGKAADCILDLLDLIPEEDASSESALDAWDLLNESLTALEGLNTKRVEGLVQQASKRISSIWKI